MACASSIEDDAFGCPHYKRNCKLVAPCCDNQAFFCRFCHDESVKDDHILNRHSVKRVICCNCQKEQQVSKRCSNCRTLFGLYFCSICKLYDMDTSKKQFHCGFCGICRVGGEDNYFHCHKCDMCLRLDHLDNHVCVEQASRSECAVCLEFLHTTRRPLHVPKCGHIIHKGCFEQLKTNGTDSCPQCKTPW